MVEGFSHCPRRGILSYVDPLFTHTSEEKVVIVTSLESYRAAMFILYDTYYLSNHPPPSSPLTLFRRAEGINRLGHKFQ